MIHVFIGTKAQLIKMAPIMRVLQDRGHDYNFIYSGQHRDTVDDILANFAISRKPDATLYHGRDITGIVQMGKWAMDIVRKYSSPAHKAELFRNDTNGIVLNHGDTFSTLLGSWLAKRHGLKSAHIESGLRSHNILHPFPEELTRLATFRLSDYFFAPGDWALANLASYKGVKINTGANTLCDALRHSEQQTAPSRNGGYGLVSIHRFENIFFRQRLTQIVDMLIASDPSRPKLFILHKPTEKKLKEYGLYERLAACGHIELHPRYDYFRFIALLRGSDYLITDGGSNQEECSYLGLPCLLMRKATERQEGLGHNTVLSGYDATVVRHFMQHPEQYRRPAQQLAQSPSELIVDSLRDFID
jgi:UDP-N-acetylglucosamine 2-epimerase (non-hydrolysing)